MQAKLLTSFDRLSEPAFFDKAQLITTAAATNILYPLPWEEHTVPPVMLTAQFEAYRAAYDATKAGDHGKISLRVAARKVLTTSFQTNASYLELVAGGNIATLQTTLYGLRNDLNNHITPDLLPAPDGFTCVRGLLSGTVMLGCDALHGAGSYKSQINLGDPTIEAGWIDSLTFKNCTHNTIPNLPVGKVVSVRMCGIGANGEGLYTNPISLMVV
jgi:hypothetical protein